MPPFLRNIIRVGIMIKKTRSEIIHSVEAETARTSKDQLAKLAKQQGYFTQLMTKTSFVISQTHVNVIKESSTYFKFIIVLNNYPE